MRFTSLGSGSSGNALVVESGTTRVMMDCGFAASETRMRLERSGLSPRDITAIVVTHEHDDHMGGVARFAKRYAIPVYLTRGTAQWLPEDFPAVLVRYIESHAPFAIGGLEVDPFPVPHDRVEAPAGSVAAWPFARPRTVAGADNAMRRKPAAAARLRPGVGIGVGRPCHAADCRAVTGRSGRATNRTGRQG